MTAATFDRRQFSRQYPSAEAIQHELALAGYIQRSQRKSSSYRIQRYEIACHSTSCIEIGGDYFDVLHSPDHQVESLKIIVGDVSGHGIDAALLMSSARAFIRARSGIPERPAELVSETNKHFCLDNAETGHFMTMFYLSIDLDTDAITWVRAGHDPAVMIIPNRDYVEELKGVGLPLGVDSNHVFKEYRLSRLPAGTVIAIGTDGIWNAHDEDAELFGKERFYNILWDKAMLGPHEIVESIFNELAAFCRNVPLGDDVTLVVVKIH